MKHKASSAIYLRDGSITTIGEALDRGVLVLRKSENFVADTRPGASGTHPDLMILDPAGSAAYEEAMRKLSAELRGGRVDD